jgi:hypothetical protein
MGALASIKQKQDVAEKVANSAKKQKLFLVATIDLHLMQIILKKVLFLQLYWCANTPLQATMFIPRKLSVRYVHSCHIKTLKN